ncbi:MAG: TRM11 family SAM-dependent methyltransferase [Aristaeellaceae bacterium]
MIYLFQLLPHANIRYQESQDFLGTAELACLLGAVGLPDVKVSPVRVGGAAFLSFTAPELTPEQLAQLARHSAMLLMCRQEEGGLLMPLSVPRPGYLPRDLAEVLKYKGKTSAVFTAMMINLALTASDFFLSQEPVTVLDPICGRGTTCFCALQQGMHAVGIELDRRDLKEAADYFSRYLQYHRLKHSLKQSSRTVRKAAVPEALYTFSDTREHERQGDVRTLRLLQGDTGLAGELLRKTPAHVLVADLPYGIQHAPQDGRKPESFTGMLRRVLPAWRDALRPGGGVAISFNTLTLPRQTLVELMDGAGLHVLTQEPYSDFSHFVEQAVTRDVVVARRE